MGSKWTRGKRGAPAPHGAILQENSLTERFQTVMPVMNLYITRLT